MGLGHTHGTEWRASWVWLVPTCDPRLFVWLHLSFWIFPQCHLPAVLSHSLEVENGACLDKGDPVYMLRGQSLFMKGELCKFSALHLLPLSSVQPTPPSCSLPWLWAASCLPSESIEITRWILQTSQHIRGWLVELGFMEFPPALA